MKRLVLFLLLAMPVVQAQEVPYFEFAWTEGDGTVPIPSENIQHFAQTVGRIEIDWTPSVVRIAGPGMNLFDIPNHLGLWVYADGVHGQWYDDAGNRRLFRSRWGLTSPDVTVKIVITWNSVGYAVIIDGVTRIHDWQTSPTIVFPDPDAVAGVYGNSVSGTSPAEGSFLLRVYDKAFIYDSCSVDTVGTINQGVPDDNSGVWDQGINPACFIGVGSATLSWIAPTENTDGTPLIDLAGYNIYYGTTSGSYTSEVTGISASVTTYVIDGLSVGTHYFVGTAFNEAGVESVFSNETAKVIDPPPGEIPSPPTNLVIDEADLVVYSVIKVDDGFALIAVGTVPSGTPCDPENDVNQHYVVPTSLVTYFNPTTESQVVVASCL